MYTPPFQPEASSAETSDVGTKNTIPGTTYRNTEARPNTAIVGAERRLATDPVVIIASATQLMYFRLPVGTVGRAGPFTGGTVVATDGWVP